VGGRGGRVGWEGGTSRRWACAAAAAAAAGAAAAGAAAAGAAGSSSSSRGRTTHWIQNWIHPNSNSSATPLLHPATPPIPRTLIRKHTCTHRHTHTHTQAHTHTHTHAHTRTHTHTHTNTNTHTHTHMHTHTHTRTHMRKHTHLPQQLPVLCTQLELRPCHRHPSHGQPRLYEFHRL